MKSQILCLFAFALITGSAIGQSVLNLRKIGSYSTNAFDHGGAEISAYDKSVKRLFTVNGLTGDIDVIDISNPSFPVYHSTIDISPWGIGANSVACNNGIIVAAVENYNKQANGFAVFFDSRGRYLKHVTVGALPDMVTFTPDGKYVLVANEGEPNSDYTVDPPGTISIINFPDINALNQSFVTEVGFNNYNFQNLPAGIKINGPGSSIAQDLEPEYIAVSADSRYAYITLQENNALAEIDILLKTVTMLKSFGFKNHNISGNGIDASDQSGSVNITTWPVFGMYQPDAITSLETSAGEFIITANEGDVRDYTGFSEAKRVSTLSLDPVAFPDAALLKSNINLGRLNVTKSMGDIDGDGDYDELYSFGGRSFSIFDKLGNLIWDSGDFLEQKTNEFFPDNFNCSNTNNTKKNRSDDKGPEPEGLITGKILDSTYVFVGLERIGGVVVFNVTDPYQPTFVQYVNTRDFSQVPAVNSGGDLGPEGMLFIRANDSPNGKNLLVTSNEVSGTIAIFETDYTCGQNRVQICENGISKCINSNWLAAYLQSGATIGNCGNLRLADAQQLQHISIHYNSETRQINLDGLFDLLGKFEISICDIAGKILYNNAYELDGGGSLNVPLSDVSPGLYLIQLRSANIKTFGKVIVD
jgi:hypothetical protein